MMAAHLFPHRASTTTSGIATAVVARVRGDITHGMKIEEIQGYLPNSAALRTVKL